MGRQLPSGSHGTDTLEVGDQLDCGSIIVTAGMIDRFAELTGDEFEIHMSQDAAKMHGFDDRVAHGLLVLSLIDGLKNQASAQFKARASLGWDWQFRRPVLAGDKLSVSLTIEGIEAAKAEDQAVLLLSFSVTNQDGVEVQKGENRLLAYR